LFSIPKWNLGKTGLWMFIFDILHTVRYIYIFFFWGGSKLYNSYNSIQHGSLFTNFQGPTNFLSTSNK
jgi:hypothetical protein